MESLNYLLLFVVIVYTKPTATNPLAGSSLIYTANGCLCYDRTPELRFCRAEFVILANIISVSGPIDKTGFLSRVEGYANFTSEYWPFLRSFVEYEYDMDILEIMRSTRLFDSARKVIRAPGPYDTCGMNLEVDHTYFIAGSVDEDNVLILDDCLFYVDMNGGDTEKIESATAMMISPPDNCYEIRKLRFHLHPDRWD